MCDCKCCKPYDGRRGWSVAGYRDIAADWHGGQASPLYAFSSSGTVICGISSEIRQNLRTMERGSRQGYGGERERLRLVALLAYVEPIEDALVVEQEEPPGRCQ